jgi:hypothetical protein
VCQTTLYDRFSAPTFTLCSRIHCKLHVKTEQRGQRYWRGFFKQISQTPSLTSSLEGSSIAVDRFFKNNCHSDGQWRVLCLLPGKGLSPYRYCNRLEQNRLQEAARVHKYALIAILTIIHTIIP